MTYYSWPIIGHTKTLLQLEADLSQGRLSHAYLLEGPAQIGKRTIARTFAQILQCPDEFCKKCPTCKQIEQSQHLDTFEFSDNGESFKIEEVRTLLTHLSTTSLNRHKIVIIQNIERITPDATNALLKTLEEPTTSVIFIFTTTHKQKLMDTLLSRVRILTLGSVSENTMKEHLLRLQSGMDAETAHTMVSFSMGKPGRAVRFVEDPDFFRLYRDLYEQIIRFFDRSLVSDRFLFIEDLMKDESLIGPFLELFVHVVRGFILQKMEGKSIPYDFSVLFSLIEKVEQTRLDLEHNVQGKLVLENLLMSF
jgi:DNA polymerase-3 subunit delta'